MQRTLWQTNIAMENGPLEDVFASENWDIPLLRQFAGMYILPMVWFFKSSYIDISYMSYFSQALQSNPDVPGYHIATWKSNISKASNP